ncbi:MAG: glucose-6-phosphate isomerase [Clostridia bacterium]|nr:glucose-6-phosphate isomerase [Clostridia bacterium]
MSVRLIDKYAHEFIDGDKLAAMKERLVKADAMLKARSEENDFKGWYDLPLNYDRDELAAIEKAAEKIRSESDVLIVIGIGGSYLGARAAIEFLRSRYYNTQRKGLPEIYFVGNSFSGDDLNDVLALCEDKEVSVNVISKSGTTTESSIAFRMVRHMMLRKYTNSEIKERVFVTTDKEKGALKAFADREGYNTFVIPDDVGGRFSVLTAVGLLPIAVCGADVKALLEGAAKMRRKIDEDGMDNDAYRYAMLRNLFYDDGKRVEILGSYEPSFRMMNEWWKQLFGESEGKDGKGLFPASVIFSADLHSLGQYIQDGERILFETIVKQKEVRKEMFIPANAVDIDGLGFLSGVKMSSVNDEAMMGTLLAHTAGGVPNLIVEYERRDEENLGELMYFFFIACAVSGYLLGVNPFDQPGVEEYKRNMYALLGKPGYEELKEELLSKIHAL